MFLLHLRTLDAQLIGFANMTSDDKSRKIHDESDSEEEDEVEIAPKLDIDVSKLTPLSPQVISKQVSADRFRLSSLYFSWNVPQATINLGTPKSPSAGHRDVDS